MTDNNLDDIHHILKKYWGYDRFRPGQEDIVRHILSGKDVFAMMATGGGKSICYQVPAIAMPGTCLVISPLIALMSDQCENLRRRGIRAEMLSSKLSGRQQDIIVDNVAYSDTKFLFLSPEKLSSPLLINRLDKLHINLIAIDEAHCISEWGHDFRPEYRKIHTITERIPDIPILALTATATKEVMQDIVSNLRMKSPYILRQSPLRPMLGYQVIQKENKKDKLVALLRQSKGSAIVYTERRKETISLAKYLKQHGLICEAYHGGMDHTRRDLILRQWSDGEVPVVVATNAFGMGIDKSDVRLVIHFRLPDSMEKYVQEAGRAGRDQQPSSAVILHNEYDLSNMQSSTDLYFPDIPTLRTVYQYLGSYFNLGVGPQPELWLSFDMNKFCEQYKLKSFDVMQCLKIYHKLDLLTLSESFLHPSRLQLLEHPIKSLLRAGDTDARLVSLLRQILRSYEGIFLDATIINEANIAKQSNLTIKQVKNALHWLDRKAFAVYQEQFDGQMIGFQYRFDSDDIDFESSAYARLKARHEVRIASMLAYVSFSGCRQKFISDYFGFELKSHCGVCDNCRSLAPKLPNKDIKSQILYLLKTENLSFENLRQKMNVQDGRTLYPIIQALIDDEIIASRGDVLLLKH